MRGRTPLGKQVRGRRASFGRWLFVADVGGQVLAGGGGVGQAVAGFVVGMAGVALDPFEGDLVPRAGGQQTLPQVDVDGLVLLVALPAVGPPPPLAKRQQRPPGVRLPD